MKFSASFLAALKQYSDQESERLNRTVSQPVILETLALLGDKRLQRLHQRILDEQKPQALASPGYKIADY